MSTESVSGTVNGDQLRFDAADAFGGDQQVANVFYYCNFMHDFFFLLGFDEKAGNFQQINFSGDGRGGDPVVARAHPGAVAQTANMIPLADGVSANMNMGLLVKSGRHTALDADVVFHEYTHGVSTRLVGGKLDAQSLAAPQSKAMGEGWSDYFALAVQNFSSETERVVIGDWLFNKPNGMRLAPYDENFPKDFSHLPSLDGAHKRGAVWCATLMQMTRNLIATLGDRSRGYRISWRMVVDGMKLTPSQPSFLDGRNAILTALDALGGDPLTDAELAACRAATWKAFARFGMGAGAACPSAQLLDIVANYTVLPA
jgi:extracellular elastinolytic metalloproteinase